MLAAAALGTTASTHGCQMSQATNYPPKLDPLPSGEAMAVEWHVVSLDEPPEERWLKVVKPHAKEIAAVANDCVKVVARILGNNTLSRLLSGLDSHLPQYYASLPDDDYGKEIKAVARVVGIDESIMFLYSIVYTVFGACTSIVAENDDGSIWHARNLDFGLWPSFNFSGHNFWEMTALLRPMVINVDVQRGGRTVFQHTTFAGFLGVHTALKPGAFSLSIDSRFDDHFDAGLLRYLLEPGAHTGAEVTLLSRHVFETAGSYAEAFALLNATRLLGPAYVILGGVGRAEGAVITKGAAGKGILAAEGKTINVWSLASAQASKDHFILETNYDHWADVLPFDDRRSPAYDCMRTRLGGPSGYNASGLYNVLSATPNLNRLTVFTTLMHAGTGRFEAYRQFCVTTATRHCPLV